VPSFVTTFWTLTVSAGLAGLVFGLLLPRASRALWAASLGTAVCGIGVTALLKQYAPGALDWLLADAVRAWAIVGVVWLLSLAYNLATCRRRTERSAGEGEGRGKPALA